MLDDICVGKSARVSNAFFLTSLRDAFKNGEKKF